MLYQFFKQLNQQHPPNLLPKTISLLPTRQWQVGYPDFWVSLGANQPLKKLMFFNKILPKILAQNPKKKLAYINMNYRNMVAVKWQN